MEDEGSDIEPDGEYAAGLEALSTESSRASRSSHSLNIVSVGLRSLSHKPAQTVENENYDSDMDEPTEEFLSKKGCKDSWCVRNIFHEVPIVGGLFAHRTSKCTKLSTMVRDVCGLAAGGAAMVLTPAEPDEGEQERITKLALAMTAGTIAGRITYNMAGSCCNGMTMLYQCCLKRAVEKMNRQQISSDKKISLH
jgi:hypothetical protein